jgi:uncharacterized protein YndB with AHSA1/START domain
MRIDFVIDIRSGVETVFCWVASPEKAMTWMTSVAGGEIIDQKPGMVGTTFRERVEDAEGGVDMEGTITAFEPNRRIGFHLESPVNVIALFAGRSMKRKIAEQSSQEFARLKELCEGPGAAGQTPRSG